jgi:3,4-dihydroxy-2-butanone 4-phosphate synthase
MTSACNPWSAAYKLAAGKRNTSTPITVLRKPDRTLTAETTETLRLMMDTFAPEDNVNDDNDYHKQVRALALTPGLTADDREFTIEEIRNTVESMNHNKAPGDDGITGDI